MSMYVERNKLDDIFVGGIEKKCNIAKNIVNYMKIISIQFILRQYKSLVKVMTLPQTQSYSWNRPY